jgi:hypothetical protein
MTGYKYEVWSDSTESRTFHCIRVTDPYGELIGEVKGISEWDVLRLAYELKKNDGPRFKAEHGIFG